jgi:putative transposase
MVFHVLNRAVGRRNLFDKPGDFEAFERVLQETLQLRPMRVCSYCWMSNHWRRFTP